jgi:plasmid stabilization system protein ParE
MRVWLHPEAQEELNETVLYYERKAQGLGLSFINEFEEVINRVKLLPESGNQVSEGIRQTFFERFEHSLIYFEFNGDLEILAVAHMKRQPKYWMSRK